MHDIVKAVALFSCFLCVSSGDRSVFASDDRLLSAQLERFKIQREKLRDEIPTGLTAASAAQARRLVPHADALLAEEEKIFGEGHPATGPSLQILGRLYYVQQKFGAAERKLKRAVEITEGVDPEHYASALKWLKQTYQSEVEVSVTQHQFPEAQAALTKLSQLKSAHESEAMDRRSSTSSKPKAEPAIPESELRQKLDEYAAELKEIRDAMSEMILRVDTSGAHRLVTRTNKLLAKQQGLLGNDHPDTAEAILALGQLYFFRQQFVAAERRFERVIQLAEPSGRPVGRNALDNLILLYETENRHADLRQAIARRDTWNQRGVAETPMAGNDQQSIRPESAQANQNLSDFGEEAKRLRDEVDDLIKQGKFDLAIKPVKRELEIVESALGPENIRVAESVDLLALLYVQQGNTAAAEPLVQRALKIRESVLGREHSDVATTLQKLAFIHHSRENYAAAQPLVQRVLKIREKSLGPEHPETVDALNNLAVLHTLQANYAAAEPLFQRSLKIIEKNRGPDHPDTARSLNNLAEVQRQQGNYSAAQPLVQRVLKIREKSLGPEHPETAEALNNLALLHKLQANYAASEPLFQRALTINEKVLGPEHPETATTLNNLGGLYESQGNYQKAEAPLQRSLKIIEKNRGPDHPDTARSLNNLAEVQRQQANYAAAEPLYQRALEINEKVLGPEHHHTATNLNNLALLYSEQANYAAAEILFQRALKIREKKLGAEHPETANSVRNLAELYKAQSNYAAAEPLYRRALKIAEKVLGPEHPQTAHSLQSLAELHKAQSNFAAAEPLYRRALKIAENVLGPEHPDTALFLQGFAGLHKAQANYAAAEPLLLRALDISEQKLGPDHPATATILNDLALLYHIQVNHAAAVPLLKRAVKINEKHFGPEYPETATSLGNLALVYTSEGNYAAAEPLYQRSLKIREKVLGHHHPDTAVSLNNLATLYDSKGNYKAAETLFDRALKIQENVFGLEAPEVATSLNNLATLHEAQEKYSTAEPLRKRALKIRERILGPHHPDTANSLNSLALYYQSQANYAAAEPLLQRALKIREKVLGPDHPETAPTLNNLAVLCVRGGDCAAAETLFRKALRIREKRLGPEHPDTAFSLHNLAMACVSQGKTAQATELIDQERKGQLAHVSRVLPALPAPEQEMFLRTKYDDSFHGALSLALSQATAAHQIQRSAAWLINGKAVAQDALAQRNLLTRDVNDPQLAPLVSELLSVRTRLAALVMNAAAAGRANERRTQLAKLTAKEQRLVGQLGGGGGNATSEWIELPRIREALPTESVLIDIARFKVIDSTANERGPTWEAARYAAWISSPTDQADTVLIDLGDAKAIDELVEKVRQQIAADAAKNGRIAEAGEEAATNELVKNLSALSKLIWQPLAPHIGDAKNIVLSPDGALWLAPWSALPTDESGNEYLLERHNLNLIVSARDLVKESDGRAAKPPVILANPQFDQKESQKKSAIKGIFKKLPPENDNATRSFSAQSTLPKVKPLPNTGIEALAIQPHIESYTRQKVGLYKEHYALEQVAKALHGPQIVSFATHGFFLPKQETKLEDHNSLLADNSRAVVLDTAGKPIENPLLRCGLLLSGCNNREATVGDDDGILTGMEITGIDFRGTELVVLSACETGVGDVRNGEGVAGLRQAFQLAGAEAVMATLWQVPDRESAVLMASFFKHLAEGQPKAEALRAAQLELIEKRRQRYGAAHPFYWAAFTLTGQ